MQRGHYWVGKKRSEETKRKISKSERGKFVSEETRLKMSLARQGDKSPSWKGGIKVNNGYISIKSLSHPFADSQSYVLEHRLAVEKYIKRFLKPKEVVHHINKIRNDNRIENLIAFINNSAHRRFHKNPASIKHYEIIFKLA